MPTMASQRRERTGVLIIRAWMDGEPPAIRMRITHTLDVAARDETSEVAASVDEACTIVRRWLDELQRRDGFVTGS